MPCPVVPSFLAPRLSSRMRSATAWSSRFRAQRVETLSLSRTRGRPFCSRVASSEKNVGTWRTTPDPIRLVVDGFTRPEGSMWLRHVSTLRGGKGGPTVALTSRR